MRPVLLLVDLQNDFLAAPGLEPAAGEVIERAARLLTGARSLRLPVAHAITSVDPVRDDRMPHWKALGRWACVRGTPGHEPPAPLRPLSGEPVLPKTYFSAFSTGELDRVLARAEADALVISGVHLHGCVRATVLDAYARGLPVWVAEDAVASDDPLHAAVTQRHLEARAARFAPVEELLRRLGERDRPGVSNSEDTPRLPVAVIGGREVHGEGVRVTMHASPRERGRRLFAVPCAGTAEVARAASAANAAGRGWSTWPAPARAALLSRMADIVESQSAALARQIACEVGKPVTLAQAEVRRAAALLRAAPAWGESTSFQCGPRSSARRRPLGVVAIVTPWNNPLAIPLGKIAQALFLSNAVVWKPAPAATRLALRALELAREAGLPEGLVNLVAGDRATSVAVMSAPGVDAVSISGSSRSGWAAQEICARRRIPLQAELGGNNAAIVWEGADLEAAAASIARGAFSFAGQRCTANRRAVVDGRLHDRFLDALAAAAGRLSWGDPLEPETEAGPLISDEACARVSAAVERARAHSRILAPHFAADQRDTLREKGAYYPPTIVVGAERASEIAAEETFGPVLVFQAAREFDEALELVNGVRQGLAAALFGGTPSLREKFLEEARAGILKLDESTADADAFAPFGGWKASGLGPPEHGALAREFYTRPQTIYGEA